MSGEAARNFWANASAAKSEMRRRHEHLLAATALLHGGDPRVVAALIAAARACESREACSETNGYKCNCAR
jgi:alpha-beta hydrolase superfamily lysophospholipase